MNPVPFTMNRVVVPKFHGAGCATFYIQVDMVPKSMLTLEMVELHGYPFPYRFSLDLISCRLRNSIHGSLVSPGD